MEFLVSDNYNEGNSFRGSFRNALRCFSGNVKRLAILARGSENRGNVRLQAFVRVIKRRVPFLVAASSLFSKPCERFNCGEKKKEQGRESTAKKRDWQLLLRFRTTKMCGRGRGRQGKLLETGMEIQLAVARSAKSERTIDGPPDRKKITTNRFYSAFFLSLSRFFETNRCQNGGIIGLSGSVPS